MTPKQKKLVENYIRKQIIKIINENTDPLISKIKWFSNPELEQQANKVKAEIIRKEPTNGLKVIKNINKLPYFKKFVEPDNTNIFVKSLLKKGKSPKEIAELILDRFYSVDMRIANSWK